MPDDASPSRSIRTWISGDSRARGKVESGQTGTDLSATVRSLLVSSGCALLEGAQGRTTLVDGSAGGAEEGAGHAFCLVSAALVLHAVINRFSKRCLQQFKSRLRFSCGQNPGYFCSDGTFNA